MFKKIFRIIEAEISTRDFYYIEQRLFSIKLLLFGLPFYWEIVTENDDSTEWAVFFDSYAEAEQWLLKTYGKNIIIKKEKYRF